jgi:hypothetical protein
VETVAAPSRQLSDEDWARVEPRLKLDWPEHDAFARQCEMIDQAADLGRQCSWQRHAKKLCQGLVWVARSDTPELLVKMTSGMLSATKHLLFPPFEDNTNRSRFGTRVVGGRSGRDPGAGGAAPEDRHSRRGASDGCSRARFPLGIWIPTPEKGDLRQLPEDRDRLVRTLVKNQLHFLARKQGGSVGAGSSGAPLADSS